MLTVTACGSGGQSQPDASGPEIPDVSGLALTEAAQRLQSAGVSYEHVVDGKSKYINNPRSWKVDETDPKAGARLAVGSQLKLLLVPGPEPVEASSPKPTNTAVKASPTPTPTPTGLSYAHSCSIGGAGATEIYDYRKAWSKPFDSCMDSSTSGTQSPAENKAAAMAGYTDPDDAKYLYSICAQTAGHYLTGDVSGDQTKEVKAALTLCPDHPKRAQLKANVAAGEALEEDRANGRLVYSGKYLVGKDVKPGTWQSQGEKVEDCYWEISDAQGNILDNNFISVAPQFNIYIPATASGFTVNGCGFRWIGG
ncbi:PASTA domain-containing protein [Arthrobacter sp. ISL-65]|uniref:PASTA domain-containing protein n=1 Tax=Arthrobacter sp. ISL-65 TaxID=2819112 RepID=UPI001BE58920|nr:PASTA domain-containing protein [Arthrobacter sp. ISL-65]MBT2548937.1 PASTA domain-containing protein [Arthrobacter sp. ISL-65]